LSSEPPLTRALGAEAIGTFALVFAGAGAVMVEAKTGALAIGATVGLDAMFGGPISGASMNPARSLGPGLVAGEFSVLWLYVVAPLIGASLGALAYQLVRGEATRPAEPLADQSGRERELKKVIR
jgi:aquaporin NIP